MEEQQHSFFRGYQICLIDITMQQAIHTEHKFTTAMKMTYKKGWMDWLQTTPDLCRNHRRIRLLPSPKLGSQNKLKSWKWQDEEWAEMIVAEVSAWWKIFRRRSHHDKYGGRVWVVVVTVVIATCWMILLTENKKKETCYSLHEWRWQSFFGPCSLPHMKMNIKLLAHTTVVLQSLPPNSMVKGGVWEKNGPNKMHKWLSVILSSQMARFFALCLSSWGWRTEGKKSWW